MKIVVRSFGIPTDRVPADGTQVEIDVPEGCTVAWLARHLGVQAEHLWMVSVNDSVVKDDFLLKAQDSVSMFAHITGG